MDLRKEFDIFLKKYGINVMLQRVDNAYTPYEEPHYKNELEIHTVRSMHPRGSQVTDAVEEEMEGLTYDADMIFYFRWDVNPTSTDRIYEYRERYPNNQLMYVIDFADPKYGQGGRIEYWVVGATRSDPE